MNQEILFPVSSPLRHIWCDKNIEAGGKDLVIYASDLFPLPRVTASLTLLCPTSSFILPK